jgi:hypothetical protein
MPITLIKTEPGTWTFYRDEDGQYAVIHDWRLPEKSDERWGVVAKMLAENIYASYDSIPSWRKPLTCGVQVSVQKLGETQSKTFVVIGTSESDKTIKLQLVEDDVG